MNSENDLMQKLLISKKIMEKHNTMGRNQNGGQINIPQTPELENFQPPQANYNIPQEFMTESKPIASTNPKPATKDKILSSKLPDEIKRLMIEHPIVPQNNMTGPSLSDELVEKAARLMNTNAAGLQINPQISKQPIRQTTQSFSGLDAETIKEIVRETVQEVLSENGLLIESVSKSNDTFSFKVGKHIFEGKVTKIKKIKE